MKCPNCASDIFGGTDKCSCGYDFLAPIIDRARKEGLNDKEIAGYKAIRDTINYFLDDVLDKWKTLDGNFVKIDVNTIVERFIETKIGPRFDDFPHELKETIERNLYEYFGLLKEATHPGWEPRKLKKTKDFDSGMDSFIKERSKLRGKVDFLSSFMGEFENIERTAPHEIDYVIRMLLDGLKYDINNIGYKPELLRIFERKWMNFRQRHTEIENPIEYGTPCGKCKANIEIYNPVNYKRYRLRCQKCGNTFYHDVCLE